MTPMYIKNRKYVDTHIKLCKKEIKELIQKMKQSNANELSEQLYILIHRSLEELYEFILNAYNIDLRNYPDVDKFLYHADGKTLKQRIDRWIEEYNKFRDKSLLYYRIGLITKHGHRYLDENLNLKLVIETNAFNYVTIDAGCEASCEDCRDHHGTYKIYENIMLPPYHPDCDCVYWFHNAPNPGDEPEDEKYEPDPVDDEWKPEQEGY